jgi:molecular chaperone GrpE
VNDPEKPKPADEAPAPDAGEREERGLVAVEVAEPEGGTSNAAAALAEEVRALKQERDDLKDQLLRRRADFENYKRRVERDRLAASQEATAELLRALVPTLDNLERALAAEADEGSLREGVALIQRELITLLENRGLAVEDPAGRAFDPERHQALSHEVVAGARPGTVVEVFRKGYLFKERLLRPALVKVAKEPSAEGEQPSEPVH